MQIDRHNVITYFIASVWLVNGLFCKVLNLVPRHQQIVSQILGADYAPILTILIGVAEIGMAIWVLSRIFPRLNAWLQIVIVILMNVLEFALVPDLLMWGIGNIVFAICFAGLVYFWAFSMQKLKDV